MSSPLSELPQLGNLPPSVNKTQVRHIRSTAIVSREVAGETIVVPICRGVGDLDSVYTFNPVGRGLWHLLEEARTAEELANWVAIRFEIEAGRALVDVQSYLLELREIGLIRTS